MKTRYPQISRPIWSILSGILASIVLGLPSAALAQSIALQNAQILNHDDEPDGGMGLAIAYCAGHAPTFVGILNDARSLGMTVSDLGAGEFSIGSSQYFPDSTIRVLPLANGVAKCVAWSAVANITQAGEALDHIVGFYVPTGNASKQSNVPVAYHYLDLPYDMDLRAFEYGGGSGATIEISGVAPGASPPSISQQRTLTDNYGQENHVLEFLLATGCLIWLPDLKTAQSILEQSDVPMSRMGNSYMYPYQSSTLMLTEGLPGQISACRVDTDAGDLAATNRIVLRSLTVSNMTFSQASNPDGTASWSGYLAERHNDTTGPMPFVARTFAREGTSSSGVIFEFVDE